MRPSAVASAMASVRVHAQPFANARSSRAGYRRRRPAPSGAVRGARPSRDCRRRRDRGANRSRRGRGAAALPRQRSAGAGDRIRGQSADAVERPALHDRQRRPRGRSARRCGPCGTAAAGARARLRDGADEYGSRWAQGAVGDVRAVEPAEGRRLRASRRARNGRHGEGDREALLRAPRQQSVLELLLERRPARAHRSAALSRRLRRHRRECPVGRSDGLHDRRDLEPARVCGDARVPGQARVGRRSSDAAVRCRRRFARRPHRRSAAMLVRSCARRSELHGRQRSLVSLFDSRRSSHGAEGLRRPAGRRRGDLPGLRSR